MHRVELYLAHHGLTVDAHDDMRRPRSERGRRALERVAAAAAERRVKPELIWHSGKLRAKQTAEVYWRACNPLAALEATRDVQPDDQPQWMADRLRFERRCILIAGHYPHLPRLLATLLNGDSAGAVSFPMHGLVALSTADDGASWSERWRLESHLEPV